MMNNQPMSTTRNSVLQSICRDYLSKLRPLAVKYGLGGFVDDMIAMNSQRRCEATESEVDLLSRAVDDERVSRLAIPTIMGKSYRRSVDDEDFDRVRRLRHVGIYSKVSALLLASEGKELNNA